MTDRPLARSLATLALAVAGPIAFFSGIGVFVMIPRGIPAPIMAIFLVALTVAGLAVLVFLALDAGQRAGD